MDRYSTYGVRGATGKSGDTKRAAFLAAELSLPWVANGHGTGVTLVVRQDRLFIQVTADESGGPHGVAGMLGLQWSRLDTVSPAGRSRQQPLLRAVLGKKRPGPHYLILDCTAGLGEDAWLLASLGCSVIAVERNPLLFALLRDQLARIGVERRIPARRFRLVWAEALAVLKHLEHREAHPEAVDAKGRGDGYLPRPDVVYLDPMFPGNRKRKTAEKKSMRLSRAIVGEYRDEEQCELLRTALAVARSRVVVKRPRKGEALCPDLASPVHRVQGRGVRYDIYPSRGHALFSS